MKKKNVTKISGCVLIFAGLSFLITSIGVIFTVIFGEDLNEFFQNDFGDSDLPWYQFLFWILVISAIVFKLAGGKFSKLFTKMFD